MTFRLRLSDEECVMLPQPAIMGVINVTHNSFYQPHTSLDVALKAADEMVAQGVDILDIGGEATNPSVNLQKEIPSEQAELDRVLPVIAAIRQRFDVLISVDTSRARVMREAVCQGADIINDQRALREDQALTTAAELKVPVCLMHFFKEPRIPGSCSPTQLMQQVKAELLERVNACEEQGITRDRIILDPGFGQGNFGKNCAENYYLLAQLKELIDLGFPVLAGWSRKSMIGDALGGVPAEKRLFGTVAANTLATCMGAHILRVHDVQAASDAVKVTQHFQAYVTKN